MEPQRIVKKHVKYPGNNTFQVFIRYTHEDQAMSDYKRYSGIITDVTPLQYDCRTDTWTFNVYGFGVYNEKMTTKEIVSQYYIKKGL